MSDLSMKPSKEDLVQRNQSVKKTGGRSSNTSGGGNGYQAAVLILLLLALVGGAAGGWYLWQQLQTVTARLENSKSALTTSEHALGSLKSELETRNESFSKQKGAVEKDIALLKSEIRKLWDVSNKRNKKNIKSNKDNVAALTKASKKYKSQLSSQVKSNASLSLSISQLHEELAKQEQARARLESNITDLKDQVAGLLTENDMLKTLAVEQEKLLQGLKNGQLQRQITEVEQSIKAIDAHRRQVNGRLDQLDKELGALYQKK